MCAEIRHTLRHLRRWAAPRRVRTPMMLFPARGRILQEPYGVALIIGPFNYPVQLLLEPLVGAIAAGNCAVLKASELTPHVAQVLAELVSQTFDSGHVALVTGGPETAQALLRCRFDTIFFTGSTRVGRLVYEAAAQHLTPVTLELGGKSPVIVSARANLAVAAERIVWGKLLNAGQTCVAPDYVLAERPIVGELTEKICKTITDFYGPDPRRSPDYGRIVTQSHTERLRGLLEEDRDRIVFGGETDVESRYVAPTVVMAQPSSACMREELFGPILPVLEVGDLDEAIRFVKEREKPLAAYVFTEDRSEAKRVTRVISFGGGCVNDTITHLINPNLPFGGVGLSGLGAYHGKASFDTFSHAKSIVTKTTRFSVRVQYPPYSEKKLGLLKKVMK